MSNPMWCDGCRAVGAIHCAHPDQCGNMLSAAAAADQWKAWIDDLPLPSTFAPAIGRLQDFITALTTLIDVPQPASPAEAEAADLRARLAAAEGRVAALTEALVDHNDLLRSALQICERAIMHDEFRVLANWDAFHDRVSVTLKKHHAATNEARAEAAALRKDEEPK